MKSIPDGERFFQVSKRQVPPFSAKSVHLSVNLPVPASFEGHAIEGVRLVLREVGVVEASARQGQDFLEQMLELDAGARYLGEFAFGNNSRVFRSTRNTLFDEKMGGMVHLALGASYPETGGVNQSALHWDMVCDPRRSGEGWVDDVLFLREGRIVVG